MTVLDPPWVRCLSYGGGLKVVSSPLTLELGTKVLRRKSRITAVNLS